MSEDRLSKIDEQIDRLQKERAEVAADAKRQEIRDAYGELERILNRIDELGENVTTDDGHVISVHGTRFYYVHGCTLQER